MNAKDDVIIPRTLSPRPIIKTTSTPFWVFEAYLDTLMNYSFVNYIGILP